MLGGAFLITCGEWFEFVLMYTGVEFDLRYGWKVPVLMFNEMSR